MQNKKGQITIFVIVGILLVLLIALFFLLVKEINPLDPQQIEEGIEIEIEQCINEQVEEAVDKIFLNGGYTEVAEKTMDFAYPPGYYKEEVFENVAYLCHTPINYARCIIIEPVFIEHLEKEIYEEIERGVERCFRDLENKLEDENYETDFSDEMNFEVELVTGKVRVEIEKEILVSKKDESEHIKEFEAVLRSPIYEMGILISEILRQESKFCGADSEGLMRENTWSEIEKYNTGYDTIIYTVKDKLSNKEIMFAVRGCIQSVPS